LNIMNTHALLWKSRVDGADDGALAESLAAAVLAAGLRISTTSLHRAVDSSALYAYLELAAPGEVSDAQVRRIEAVLAARMGEDGGLDRLQLVFRAAGASADMSPAFQYVVETDPAEGWRDEMFRWYDEEHMPGLAASPGCTLARRYLNHDRGPVSLACYDLVTPEATATPAWLAVRGTRWSSRIRPQFRNTLRTMFRSLPPRKA
jgi:hypothetical protein